MCRPDWPTYGLGKAVPGQAWIDEGPRPGRAALAPGTLTLVVRSHADNRQCTDPPPGRDETNRAAARPSNPCRCRFDVYILLGSIRWREMDSRNGHLGCCN